jgi:hypothetical protein
MASSFGVLRCGKATAFGSVLSKTGTQGRRPVAGSTRVFAAQFRREPPPRSALAFTKFTGLRQTAGGIGRGHQDLNVSLQQAVHKAVKTCTPTGGLGTYMEMGPSDSTTTFLSLPSMIQDFFTQQPLILPVWFVPAVVSFNLAWSIPGGSVLAKLATAVGGALLSAILSVLVSKKFNPDPVEVLKERLTRLEKKQDLEKDVYSQVFELIYSDVKAREELLFFSKFSKDDEEFWLACKIFVSNRSSD